MTDAQQRAAARSFSAQWKDQGYEKGQTQKFWLSLLGDVLGVADPYSYIDFENKVLIEHTGFIDAYIPSTKVLIEQKSLGKDLRAPIRQSDGSLLSPFQQAKRYIADLPVDMHPRWVITCNFSEFNIYDMNKPQGEPEIIYLRDLEKEYYRLSFLVDSSNEHLKKELEVSMAAGKVVGMLYDALAKQYLNPESEESSKSLNLLCVRLVFCFYAEDAGIFGRHDMFHDYLSSFEARHLRQALIRLFKVLDTPQSGRDPYLEPELAAFPYVNGGLFTDTSVEIPQFTEEIKDIILERASRDFDWSQISPTIFGSLFESTLNPETRHAGGMHYTSIENIHKVIDPLFMDSLHREFEQISSIKDIKKKRAALWELQERMASLTFLDPACGSGNFLTETYLSLRRLENRILESLFGENRTLGSGFSPIKVSIGQFYGIEINDYAANVARTALWIAESQMMKQTEDIVQADLDMLPLKSYPNIVTGNALQTDWESVVPKDRLDYVMGNPPFLGYSNQSKAQKEDMLSVFVDEKGKPYKTAGKIDYVAGWYFKACSLMKDTDVKAAFVSTNSITQGEQVAGVWKPLYERFGIHIDFAHRTFRWDNEASDKAHVHCVIVGFSCTYNPAPKTIYTDGRAQIVKNINGYLIDADNVFVESRSKPLCDVPAMVYGNKPVDGGHLFLTKDERDGLLRTEPENSKYIRRILGSQEYINNEERYCLWLVGANPTELRRSKFIMSRVEKVKEMRLASPKEATRKSAETPTLFQEVRQPDTEYIIVPSVSSENRKYIPIGFIAPEIIVNNAVLIIPSATLYHFGVLTSNVHMAWMRAVCGRLEMRYRYSKDIVYNNFPWPEPTQEQREHIGQTARAILEARALYPDSSLADLYDELTMPSELRTAHQSNDRAVMAAYGFDIRTTTESSCVAELMKLYRKLTY